MKPFGPEQHGPGPLLRPLPPAIRLADGVELLGQYRDSGLQDPPYLIRRGGTVLQVSKLLTVVAAAATGRRDFDEIAAAVSAQLGRRVAGDTVRRLVELKLVPAGIVSIDGEATIRPPPAPDRRALALRYRRPVVPSESVNDVARILRVLFRPAVVAGILTAVVAFDGWLFGIHGVRGALEQVIRQPGLLAFLLIVGWLSCIFHEFGHAAGCHYSGARPGAVGAGIYLIWPVLFTNVTDAYRLNRRGRLRTDLGGIYFNSVFIVALAGTYLVTGYEPILAAVVGQHFLILDQLMPWVRFDGYYVVSDLTGVSDILDRVKPALLSLIPGRSRPPEVLALRPPARRLLYAYLGSMIMFVAISVGTLLVQGPTLIAASWDSLPSHLEALRTAIGMWDLPMAVLVVVQIGMVLTPVAGVVLLVPLLGFRVASRRRHPGHLAAA